jgi:hypothetical protein
MRRFGGVLLSGSSAMRARTVFSALKRKCRISDACNACKLGLAQFGRAAVEEKQNCRIERTPDDEEERPIRRLHQGDQRRHADRHSRALRQVPGSVLTLPRQVAFQSGDERIQTAVKTPAGALTEPVAAVWITLLVANVVQGGRKCIVVHTKPSLRIRALRICGERSPRHAERSNP